MTNGNVRDRLIAGLQAETLPWPVGPPRPGGNVVRPPLGNLLPDAYDAFAGCRQTLCAAQILFRPVVRLRLASVFGIVGALGLTFTVGLVPPAAAVAIPAYLDIVDVRVDDGVDVVREMVISVICERNPNEEYLRLRYNYEIIAPCAFTSFGTTSSSVLQEAIFEMAVDEFAYELNDGYATNPEHLVRSTATTSVVSETVQYGAGGSIVGTLEMPIMPMPGTEFIRVHERAKWWDGFSLDAAAQPIYETVDTVSWIAMDCTGSVYDDPGRGQDVPPIGFACDDNHPNPLVQPYAMNTNRQMVVVTMGDSCDQTGPLATCESHSTGAAAAKPCEPPSTCEDGGSYETTCNLLVDLLVEALSPVVPYLPSMESSRAPPPASGEAGAHWSINFVQEIEALQPIESEESASAALGRIVSGGENPAGQAYVAVGDVGVDFFEAGEVTQLKGVAPGAYWEDAQSEDAPSKGEKRLETARCAVGMLGLVALAPSAALGGTAALYAFAAMEVGFACIDMVNALTDPGKISCGFAPPSVTWGGQVYDGQIISIGPVTVAGASSGPATTTVWFGAEGEQLNNGSTVIVHPQWFAGYKQGKKDCEDAWTTAKNAANAAAQNYGTTQGEGSANILATLTLSPYVPTDTLYELQGDLLWSPAQGLVVECSDSGCPAELQLEVSQCGTVVLRGGTPAEVQYLFDGDPLACPTKTTATVYHPTGTTSTSLDTPIVLHLETQAGGNSGIVEDPTAPIPQLCMGPAVGTSCAP